VTDAEFAALSDWERQEWFDEIHPIMQALMSVPPLVICEFGPDVFAEFEEDDNGV
jgi:hypothetical protein